MLMRPVTEDAYRLLHEGCIALSQVEANGIRIDTDYLERALAEADQKIKHYDGECRNDQVYHAWRRRYGAKTNLNSKGQLGTVIFDVLGYERKYDGEARSDSVKKRQGKNSEGAFEHVELDFLKNYFLKSKYQGGKNKLLEIKAEVVDGYLHPFFNLHTARTYRSSSDKPNFTSIPIRNEAIGKLVRRCFVPRKGYQLVENDLGGAELRGIACYTKDPALIDYVLKSDIHGDFAAKVYKVKRKQVSKLLRHAAKNKFVFPNFYGSYYVDCARDLWDIMEKDQLKLEDGTPLKKHLASKGITKMGKCDPELDPKPGTLEYHVREVEKEFWGIFHKSKECREEWWDDYAEKGYVETLTGFVLQEVYKRNQIINSRVQGSIFHCCLQLLIWMNKWLKKHKFKSRIVGEIHDSIIGDVHPRELDDYLHAIHRFCSVRLPKFWPWLIVAPEIEAEVCPVDGDWTQKRGVKIAA